MTVLESNEQTAFYLWSTTKFVVYLFSHFYILFSVFVTFTWITVKRVNKTLGKQEDMIVQALNPSAIRVRYDGDVPRNTIALPLLH